MIIDRYTFEEVQKLYEDIALGKVTDERLLHMSQKYGVEREELKTKIAKLYEELEASGEKKNKSTAIAMLKLVGENT